MPLTQPEEKIQTQTPGYRICGRCIMDTTVPGIEFDEKGECNFCKLHDKLCAMFPLTEEGQKNFQKIVERVRKKGRGRKYDCIVGISGGRDSIYVLYYVTKVLKLRPLAVHFNNGFGNPIAGENMLKACTKLGLELRTITSDWREAKDLKIAQFKASIPDLTLETDLGLAAALYGTAVKERVKTIIIGQSFRTEGTCPLSWNYLDGKYLRSINKQFGERPIRPWKPADPGFNLDIFQMLYYVVWKRISVLPVLYYVPYVRKEVDELIQKDFDWVNPGAHYFDDLFQSLAHHVLMTKFKIDRRLYPYSAMVRSGQLTREGALEKMKQPYALGNPEIVDLCLKRLGQTRADMEGWLALPPKTFRDYPTHYDVISKYKGLIKFLSKICLLPPTTYDKYFNCGK